MAKSSTYQEKFARLNAWVPQIVTAIKKDLRNDHLRRDLAFSKRFFAGKNVTKLTNEELAGGYAEALKESEVAELIGEFIANRWLLKKGDVYNYFVTRLTRVNPDFTEIEELENDVARQIIDESVNEFGVHDVYFFSVLNAVALPEKIFDELHERAGRESAEIQTNTQSEQIERSLDKLVRDHEQQMSRTIEKYEKKLQGLERKYHHDTEVLKKQIARLQKQQVG